jgi:PAS domain S-box-containing protein
MCSVVIGMIVWSTVVSIVLYIDYMHSYEPFARSSISTHPHWEFLATEVPGYFVLWAIGMISMTVMRFRVRRFTHSLESANTHLAADRMRSEKAETIASFGHWELNLNNQTFRGSQGAAAIYGLQNSAWSIALVQSVPFPEYRPALDKALADLIAGRAPYDIEFKIRRPGDGIIRDIHSVAMYDRTTNLVTGVIHDVTEFHAAQRSLQESERRYRLLADNAIDVIWTTDLEGKFTYVSPSILQLHGVSPDETLQKTVEDVIMPGSRHVVHQALRGVVRDALAGANSAPVYLEIEQPRKDGTTVWTEVTTRVLFGEDGTPLGLLGVSRDISLRRAYREQLETSLRDKDVLLREVHHRVKNNLQVISSLLNLQADSYNDLQARTLLKESQLRIRSMALVHEKLYRSPHLSSIDFQDYLTTMTRDLVRSFGNVAVSTHVTGDEIHLDIEKAIPAGLIVNELFTNALKHAFPPHIRNASIDVAVRQNADGAIALTVEDNGIGIPADMNIEEARTMGMTVIQGLTMQLDGTISLLAGPGARFQLRFPMGRQDL